MIVHTNFVTYATFPTASSLRKPKRLKVIDLMNVVTLKL